MATRIWLHEGHDGEPGIEAWAPELLGFATWAETREALLEKLPAKLAAYRDWRERHGAPAGRLDVEIEIEVEATLHGNEILFAPDREPASRAEVELAIHLLDGSRADLIATLDAAPVAALDWDPPYRRFAPWASWRTIRANLAHIADAETHYYLCNLGFEPESPPLDPSGDWRAPFARARAEARHSLERLAASADLSRVRRLALPYGEEEWSVRKALRRMVAHELQHAKSIARIVRAHAERFR